MKRGKPNQTQSQFHQPSIVLNRLVCRRYLPRWWMVLGRRSTGILMNNHIFTAFSHLLLCCQAQPCTLPITSHRFTFLCSPCRRGSVACRRRWGRTPVITPADRTGAVHIGGWRSNARWPKCPRLRVDDATSRSLGGWVKVGAILSTRCG